MNLCLTCGAERGTTSENARYPVSTLQSAPQGGRHEPWVGYLPGVRPEIVVRYKPILELSDSEKLWDTSLCSTHARGGIFVGYYTTLR